MGADAGAACSGCSGADGEEEDDGRGHERELWKLRRLSLFVNDGNKGRSQRLAREGNNTATPLSATEVCGRQTGRGVGDNDHT